MILMIWFGYYHLFDSAGTLNVLLSTVLTVKFDKIIDIIRLNVAILIS